VILADAIFAPVADVTYGAVYSAALVDVWLGTLAFAGQIFFDFAGYSTCGIGAALCSPPSSRSNCSTWPDTDPGIDHRPPISPFAF
jgi:D-alanyl-lipoteichoic acid acyltransferase DltB (MBOAT superfamily)